jgi:flagellar biosynthesis/type III secretory pathway M-ring protein FliF/YscJ
MVDSKEAEAEAKRSIARRVRSRRMRVAAALIVTALVGFIMLHGQAGDKKLLFSGLELEEALTIASKLDTAGIAYSLEGRGTAVFVDADKVDQARRKLAE